MKQLVTQAIILTRIDYGEADRILTLLTPHHGKLRLLAKGVRRVKSKLAGGIELFSISEITFIKGRGEIGTLVSTRLSQHYAHIVADLERTMAGYDFIKLLNTLTEDEAGEEYFHLLHEAFEVLNDLTLPLTLARFWFDVSILRLEGQSPNLQTDTDGQQLDARKTYSFSIDRGALAVDGLGKLRTAEIKLLRLAFSGHSAKALVNIQGIQGFLDTVAPLMSTMRRTFLRV